MANCNAQGYVHHGTAVLKIHAKYHKVKAKCTSLDRPWGIQDFEAPRIHENRHMKVRRLSALHNDRLYPPGNILLRLQLKCDGTRWRRERKWRGNWRIKWVASTLHTTSEHGVPSITTADAHTSAASSRLNWRPPPADLNGLVRFAERRNLVSARVPSHFNSPLQFIVLPYDGPMILL